MTPAKRIAVALDLTEELRAHLAAGLQHRHPEWPEQRVRAAVAERCLAAQGLRHAEGHYVPLLQREAERLGLAERWSEVSRR